MGILRTQFDSARPTRMGFRSGRSPSVSTRPLTTPRKSRCRCQCRASGCSSICTTSQGSIWRRATHIHPFSQVATSSPLHTLNHHFYPSTHPQSHDPTAPASRPTVPPIHTLNAAALCLHQSSSHAPSCTHPTHLSNPSHIQIKQCDISGFYADLYEAFAPMVTFPAPPRPISPGG